MLILFHLGWNHQLWLYTHEFGETSLVPIDLPAGDVWLMIDEAPVGVVKQTFAGSFSVEGDSIR